MSAGEVFWSGLLIMAAVVLLFGTGAWAIYHVWPEFWAWLFPVDDEAAETDARDELHCLDEPRTLPDWSEIERFLAMHERANIAKRRREKFGRQQMEHIWHDTTGGDAAIDDLMTAAQDVAARGGKRSGGVLWMPSDDEAVRHDH